jgi:hypothetical protein
VSPEDYFSDRFDALKNRYSGLTGHIHLVSRQDMDSDSGLLNLCGIEHDKKLSFTDSAIGDISPTDYGTQNAGGLTIAFTQDGARQSAIFINDEMIDGENHSGISWLWRYCSLHHELMHALDQSKQKNFDYYRMTVDLIGAEAFADTKTLKHLQSGNHPYMGFALGQYAKNILSVRDNGPVRAGIFCRIVAIVGAKSLDYWASDAFNDALHDRWD